MKDTVRDVVILGAARTPIGSFLGSLAELSAPELGARALAGAFAHARLEPRDIEQVNLGCVLTAGVGQAPARQAALGAACLPSTGATTLGKVCGSGMRAVMMTANDLRCGDFEVAAAGGMESMSRAPHLLRDARRGLRLGHRELSDSMILDGLWDPYSDVHMGSCADLCASTRTISRSRQDDFAIESYRRARAATEDGSFARELVAVEVTSRKETRQVVRDEDPFRVDLERSRSLRPAFGDDGTVTAGNASNLSDGAAALVLSTADYAQRRGLKPLARVVGHATVAQQPEWFTTAPIAAITKVLERTGLAVEDIDLFEINEAFAVVVLATMDELGLAHERVNVNGGAVALGHPIGASGARILVTLIHALHRRQLRRGCAAICIGGGEATAMVVERL